MKRILFFLLLLSAVRVLGATNYYFDSTPFTTYGEFFRTPTYSGSNDGHTVYQLLPSQSIRFCSNSSSVGIYSFTSTAAGRTYVLRQRLQGGSNTSWTQVGSVVIPASGAGSWSIYNLATGLSTGTVYQYEILCILPIQVPGNEGSWFDEYLELDTGSLATVVNPQRLVWCGYGDSITNMGASRKTDNASGLIDDARGGDIWQFTDATNQAMVISAVSGGKVVNTGRDGTGMIPTNVDAVRVEYGINDEPDLPAGNATFQTAYGVMIDNIRTRIGAGKPIICCQPFPQLGATQRANMATLIQAAILGKSDVYYTGTDSWVPTSATYLWDGTHPNLAGYVLLGNRQVPIYSTTAITITGPSSGAVSVASSTFTVTMSNAATFTGDQTVTLTASNGTITVTAAGGSISSNGTATPVVTPAAGQVSFTFTYTPSTSGVKTLTPTSGQDLWTMPTATNYTATSGAAQSSAMSGKASLLGKFKLQ